MLEKWEINIKKVEQLTSGLENEEKLKIENEANFNKVNKLKYLGSVLKSDEESYCKIEKRIS